MLTDARTEAQLLPLLQKHLHNMFGKDAQTSESYGRIVNARHLDRLRGLLGTGSIALGGRFDTRDRYLEPTILTNIQAGDPVMQEEIFGPILPIVQIDDLEEALAHVRGGDKPLAAYLFTKSDEAEARFVKVISAGSMCINDVLMFSAVSELPFGGVGESGMGAYKGERGFLNFSHQKAVMKRSWWPDIPLRYAPYSKSKFSIIKKLR